MKAFSKSRYLRKKATRPSENPIATKASQKAKAKLCQYKPPSVSKMPRAAPPTIIIAPQNERQGLRRIRRRLLGGLQGSQRRVGQAEEQQSLDEPERTRRTDPPEGTQVLEIGLASSRAASDIAVVHDEVADEGIDDEHVDEQRNSQSKEPLPDEGRGPPLCEGFRGEIGGQEEQNAHEPGLRE